ncbi:hypothetical protein [Saccharopolyspora griseoalba]|uniref:Uncharacterized protein n=1 Tax=Saccharopolyspora griseoalba TaxID=1431848 RepID=A0ABW2LTE6_9PSEU
MPETHHPHLPYFERGLLDELHERHEGTWSWRIDDLVKPGVYGCGHRAIKRGVDNLVDWGYLQIWKEGLGPGRGWRHRWRLHTDDKAGGSYPNQLPYFERGLLAELAERHEQAWTWRINDLVMTGVHKCSYRAVKRGIDNLVSWGFLQVWTELEPEQGWQHRWQLYPHGDAPKPDTTHSGKHQ